MRITQAIKTSEDALVDGLRNVNTVQVAHAKHTKRLAKLCVKHTLHSQSPLLMTLLATPHPGLPRLYPVAATPSCSY